MPVLQVWTNVEKAKIPADFLASASSLIADLLGKPEGYVTVIVHPDQMMQHGGAAGPCAFLFLSSIGGVSGGANKKTSKAIAELMQKALGIPSNKFYIKFDDMPGSCCGHNGGTF